MTVRTETRPFRFLLAAAGESTARDYYSCCSEWIRHHPGRRTAGCQEPAMQKQCRGEQKENIFLPRQEQ
jgi:hypothetical protein